MLHTHLAFISFLLTCLLRVLSEKQNIQYMWTCPSLSQKRLKKYEAIHYIDTTLEEKNARLLIVPFDVYASDDSYED